MYDALRGAGCAFRVAGHAVRDTQYGLGGAGSAFRVPGKEYRKGYDEKLQRFGNISIVI
jgi:hypothetical protein